MKKNDRKLDDFYLYSDLNNLSFYLYCPSLNNEKKKEISNIIINNSGVRKNDIIYKQNIISSLKSDTIIVIENRKFIEKRHNDELIKEYGNILLYSNNHIEKIEINKHNSSIIRMITVKSLREEIEFLIPKSFNFFIEKGLESHLNPKLTIAILVKQNNKDKDDLLKYHCFNNSKLEIKNDIPSYHPDVPDGFSLFCNQLEYLQLIAFIAKNKNKLKKNNRINNDIIETEPEPNKRHFICQICKTKFDNYKEHISSIQHNHNKLKYTNTFFNIKLTFRRIVNYNESKKLKNLNETLNEDKTMDIIELKDSNEKLDKFISYINLDETNNATTKDDSLKITYDENKNVNKKIYKGDLVDLTTIKNNKNDNMIENEVLNILHSIHCNPKKNLCNIKKRKTNEQNKYFFNDNYIYDLQKITGKISYFYTLNNMNK